MREIKRKTEYNVLAETATQKTTYLAFFSVLLPNNLKTGKSKTNAQT